MRTKIAPSQIQSEHANVVESGGAVTGHQSEVDNYVTDYRPTSQNGAPGTENLLRHLESNRHQLLVDVGLLGKTEDVSAFAWKEDRVIITHDPDFIDDRRFPPKRNPGIVLIRPGSNGRNDRGLKVCLIKMLHIAREHASWFRGRKLDYSSETNLTIAWQGTRQLYKWERNKDPMV